MPMGLSRLAGSLQLPKSSVHALCNTLLALGYLRRQGDAGFTIGPRVMPLADAFVSGTDVAQAFNAVWDEAGSLPEETVILSVLNGGDVVYVAARHGSRPLGLAFRVGMRLPAHLAASGRAMLAWLGTPAVCGLFDGTPLAQPARGGPLTLEALLEELAATRARGYSLDDEGVREGVHCFGAPVFDAAGAVVAGVGVCLQKAVLDAGMRARQLDTVLRVAAQLSQRLGGRVPPAGR
ncbi:IclR family transcriptional regulator [Piscinibacter sakaiensis]|uniref:IclR family transcriptional regulator n=1 Tax=Piscinibacter sakaiensis TaxID=1547922 RepID=UPI0037292C2A